MSRDEQLVNTHTQGSYTLWLMILAVNHTEDRKTSVKFKKTDRYFKTFFIFWPIICVL